MTIKFYAVARGFTPGIYNNWQSCKNQVHRFPNNKFKSFERYEDACKYMSLYAPDYKPVELRGPMDKFLKTVDDL